MKYGKTLLILMLTILVISCASSPEKVSIVPGWYLNPPSSNKEFLYFTISVQLPLTEDIEDAAGQELYKEIMTSIKVSESNSSLEDFSQIKNEIINLVKGEPVPGFSLIEKQIDLLDAEHVIYILVELNQEQLSEIEDKVEDILRAGSSASIFSQDAEEFIKNGDIYNGTLSYIKAALESAESANSFITEKNLSSAIEQLDKVSILKLESPNSIAVGENGVFTATMSSSDGNENNIWNDVSVKVSFRDRKKGSIIGDRFALIRTDDKGLVTFVHPSPGFTGDGKVEIALDLFRDTGSLELLELNNQEKLDELKAKAESIKVSFDFDIISSAPFVSTGILIIDSDFLRKPLDSINTAEGLYNSLLNTGFNVSLLNVDRSRLLDLTEKEFLRDIPYMVESDVKRVIYGVARISDFDDSATGFTVVTEAEIKVVDLDSGEILFEDTMDKRVQGGESQSTINTSFKELGKSFSSLLIDKLP